MRAYSLLKARPEYRAEAFHEGLAAAGYAVVEGYADQEIAADDLCLIWNRYGARDRIAGQFEAAGARVLVAENGYIGGPPKKDPPGADPERYFYALARGGHNGAGTWRVGGQDRLVALGVKFQPWRRYGRHVLICGQRGGGYNAMAMPDAWPDAVAAELRGHTDRPLRFRPHPTRSASQPALAFDLAGAWAVVTWTSAAIVEALIAGIPAFYCGPASVVDAVAARGITEIEDPCKRGVSRMHAFRRLAWAQWRIPEIRSGEAFEWLLA